MKNDELLAIRDHKALISEIVVKRLSLKTMDKKLSVATDDKKPLTM